MTMSEKEFAEFLKAHPDIQFNEKTNRATHKKQNNKFENQNAISILFENNTSKKNKYGNVKVYEDEFGMISDKKEKLKGKCVRVFDSTKEFKRWCELKLMQEAGEIQNLDRQVSLMIQEAFVYKGKKISAITYKADFTYTRNNEEVIEDVKPFDIEKQKHLTTKDFNLKWKLLKGKYPKKSFEIY